MALTFSESRPIDDPDLGLESGNFYRHRAAVGGTSGGTYKRLTEMKPHS